MTDLSILEIFREHILANKTIQQNDWHQYQNALFKRGFGMEETLQFLYFERPDIQGFQDWVIKNSRIIENKSIENLADVLTKDDLEFWNKNGYLVIKNAISTQDCEQTQAAILAYLGASLDHPNSWYQDHKAKEGLMVLFTKHPTLDKNRQSAKILKAYQQLYKTEQLFQVIDKVSFNPPENDTYQFRGSLLHWDVSLSPPIPYKLQGLLYLTDVKADSGAFHCVPGFHLQIEDWLQSLSSDTNPRDYAIQSLKPIPILGNAGDFVIWHQALPHCATPNTSHLPRMVQYLTYLPNENTEVAQEWI